MTDSNHDAVNHPKHYTSCPSGVECIEIAELLPFCLGNCYKYLHRAGLKGDTKQDLKKARFYANRAFFNGEAMPNVVKSRINYVASHQDVNNVELLAFFRHWDADAGGKSATTFIKQLDEKIDKLEAWSEDKKLIKQIITGELNRKIFGYRMGLMGSDAPVYDNGHSQHIDSTTPQDI
ncbi:Protein of unknwon function [Moraxella cuniculi DSM 21768]|uniref:Protein of unknwon function n=1 Tax=Moraxella cuniculi DSM 21768 TaxID=1122245 RepID=A0A1N7G6X1_9GAMM|nr:DUF3310 domain-containing protein [Moraxella cuniculi]OOS04363.1 hypothetical protein B0189_08620 [Moraxella cuniculi]SIS08298.1 Protein of unknwon function [Moraxella cuniculi DSM 21768]